MRQSGGYCCDIRQASYLRRRGIKNRLRYGGIVFLKAPPPKRSIRFQGQASFIARGNLLNAGKITDCDRYYATRRIALAQLTIVILSPRSDGAILKQGKRVEATCFHSDHVAQHRNWRIAITDSAITDLALLVRAP